MKWREKEGGEEGRGEERRERKKEKEKGRKACYQDWQRRLCAIQMLSPGYYDSERRQGVSLSFSLIHTQTAQEEVHTGQGQSLPENTKHIYGHPTHITTQHTHTCLSLCVCVFRGGHHIVHHSLLPSLTENTSLYLVSFPLALSPFLTGRPTDTQLKVNSSTRYRLTSPFIIRTFWSFVFVQINNV